MTFEEFVMKVQQISKVGLMYSKDPYAIENYTELESLSREMLNAHLVDFTITKNVFERDTYPTPSSSVRVLVFNEKNEILMVKEQDGGWAVPGGWCEINLSLKENARKEVKEEANVDIEIDRLLAIHLRKLVTCNEYVHYYSAKALSHDLKPNHETMDVRYFNVNELPTLSLKNSQKEIETALDVYLNHRAVYSE